jgi:hypothetical protein
MKGDLPQLGCVVVMRTVGALLRRQLCYQNLQFQVSAGTHFFEMKVISKNVYFSSSFEQNPQYRYVKSTQH